MIGAAGSVHPITSATNPISGPWLRVDLRPLPFEALDSRHSDVQHVSNGSTGVWLFQLSMCTTPEQHGRPSIKRIINDDGSREVPDDQQVLSKLTAGVS